MFVNKKTQLETLERGYLGKRRGREVRGEKNEGIDFVIIVVPGCIYPFPFSFSLFPLLRLTYRMMFFL